ncbi:MAG: choice-of-anchor D domain-containing protein [Candidatus Acidiferrales bacterium]
MPVPDWPEVQGNRLAQNCTPAELLGGGLPITITGMKLRVHERLGTGQRNFRRRNVKLLAACFVGLIALGTSGCAGVTSAKSTAQTTPLSQPQLVVVPNSVNFQSVLVGQKNTQTLQLSNSGSAALNVQQIQVTGAGFQVTPPSLPLALAPGANQIFSLAFAPAATGNVSGTLTISSNDPKSPANLAVLGDGVVAGTHKVQLSWGASTSQIIGYFVYRGNISGGPYARVTASPVNSLGFTDASVSLATSYYYVVTSVDSAGVESVFSNETPAVIPTT